MLKPECAVPKRGPDLFGFSTKEFRPPGIVVHHHDSSTGRLWRHNVILPMLLDAWMPEFDVAARYDAAVDAPPERVWRAIQEMRSGDLPLVRWLMALRRLDFRRPPQIPVLEAMTREGFLVLEQRQNDEVVIGVAGRFWTHSGGIVRMASPEAWRNYAAVGSARSAMNFRLEGGRVITETRVQTFGASARRSFRLYWTLVGPFSGLIRRAFLAEIRRRARRASDYPQTT